MQLALAMAIAATTAMAISSQTGTKTAWDGVYTETQAERGRQEYRRACSPCHGVDLAGGDDGAPALVGSLLTASWHDKTLDRIVGALRDSMPKDNPGGLTLAAYTDVVAFLLQSNDAAPGRDELPPDLAILRRIRFVEEANR
jgi:S-disulfanyl-L-cysteine oxidoreductase SoxD